MSIEASVSESLGAIKREKKSHFGTLTRTWIRNGSRSFATRDSGGSSNAV